MSDFPQNPTPASNVSMTRAGVPVPDAPRVHVVATGGTIAMRLDPEQGGALPAVSGVSLVAAVPKVAHVAQLSVREFSNIPSEHMTPESWIRLAAYLQGVIAAGQAHGIVITHGTDTMEETAFLLDLTVVDDTPIVLTGAQRPASRPDADGPGNLSDAIRIAADPQSRGRGVMIAMHGEIHTAREAIKASTEGLDAFDSWSGTELGYVENGQVHFANETLPRRHLPLPMAEELPRVDIIPMYAGADDAALQAALAAGSIGLVIAGVGAGNVNQALFYATQAALQQDIAVVISTRVPHGLVRPLYAYSGGGMSLRRAGAIMAGDLTPQKARVLLMLGLAAEKSGAALRMLFEGSAT